LPYQPYISPDEAIKEWLEIENEEKIDEDIKIEDNSVR